jgi:hypothetical protein
LWHVLKNHLWHVLKNNIRQVRDFSSYEYSFTTAFSFLFETAGTRCTVTRFDHHHHVNVVVLLDGCCRLGMNDRREFFNVPLARVGTTHMFYV